jgi:nicotinate dehydrogenase subunit B
MNANLPPSLAANPRLSAWLRVKPDGGVEIRPGKVELGQGVLTALAQVAAEELDVDIEQIEVLPATTGVSPNEGYTAGSLSIQNSAAALRLACAEARSRYLGAAAAALEVPPEKLTVASGLFHAPDGRRVSYWELADDALLDQDATGEQPPKPAAVYRLVGTNVPRLDLPDKLTGRPRYVHDLEFDGLCHGRVVRPPSRGATLDALDEAPARALPGVLAVVRDGSFVGVVADREEIAIQAAERLRQAASWSRRATLPDEEDLPRFLVSADAETTVLAERGTASAADGAPASFAATYHRPYLAHASMGPSSATALYGDAAPPVLRVWSHSQGPYLLRAELARALGLPQDDITVAHAEGAGCYGHNGADDVALDAALLAMALPGRPVKVVWSRADELGWAPFGAPGVVRLDADVDSVGNVLSWRHEIWGNGHSTRGGSIRSVALLGASHRESGSEIDPAGEPPLSVGGGAGRNAVPYYDFPAYRVVNHRLLEMPLRVSALRSLGAFLNVFAAESFMDELAAAAGRDPVAYRLAQLSDLRGRAVIEAAARRAGWSSWAGGDAIGHGVAFARYKNTSAYCAVIAEVEAVSEIRVRRLTIAVDAGLVINPDGAANQIEGGAVQATSWALKERVRFDRYGVTSDSWETYPILRFSEVPAVDVELLAGAGNPSLGVGETAQGPTVAAIANAVCDALGVRVRTLPLSPENVLAAMPDLRACLVYVRPRIALAGGRSPRITETMSSACLVAATSWARKIRAPSHAATAVTASVPASRSSRPTPSDSPTKSLRDADSSTGHPVVIISPMRRVISSDCQVFFPKSCVGSMMIRAGSTPARSARPARASTRARTSAMTSEYVTRCGRVRGSSLPTCEHTIPAPNSAATSVTFGSQPLQVSLSRSAPASHTARPTSCRHVSALMTRSG